MKKGFTLIEVVVSIAILGILAAGLLAAFSNGFSTIFIMGNKSKAIARAQEIIDFTYEKRNNGLTAMTNLLDTKSSLSSADQVYTYEAGKESKYCLKNLAMNYVVDGILTPFTFNQLTLVVFYNNGKQYVSIDTLLPNGGL